MRWNFEEVGYNKQMKKEIEKILNRDELDVIKRLSTPDKVQNFLDKLPFNFEKSRETYRSPRGVLRRKKAHCFEGVLFAYLCLSYHGIENYVIDLKVKKSAWEDSDHTLCIFKINDYWGAISKTNHSILRWRDPIYKNVRELTFSYFHEYFLDDGEKTLQSFSRPFNVWKKFGIKWIVDKNDLDEIAKALDQSPHIDFVPEKNKKFIRKVGKTEIKGALVTEWQKNGKLVR